MKEFFIARNIFIFFMGGSRPHALTTSCCNNATADVFLQH